ncbi:MAG: ElyC/SanA/YdcF family protein, partial [Endomicrobiaceae bacterium]|nr:ElyC/SanA/YdcF family protein [Endomicrobiaceae bacterium]
DFSFGLATDPDGDRFCVKDIGGNHMTPDEIGVIDTYELLENIIAQMKAKRDAGQLTLSEIKKFEGLIVKNIVTTFALDELAKKYSEDFMNIAFGDDNTAIGTEIKSEYRTKYEKKEYIPFSVITTSVGWKNIADTQKSIEKSGKKFLIGVESSGGISIGLYDKDGAPATMMPILFAVNRQESLAQLLEKVEKKIGFKVHSIELSIKFNDIVEKEIEQLTQDILDVKVYENQFDEADSSNITVKKTLTPSQTAKIIEWSKKQLYETDEWYENKDFKEIVLEIVRKIADKRQKAFIDWIDQTDEAEITELIYRLGMPKELKVINIIKLPQQGMQIQLAGPDYKEGDLIKTLLTLRASGTEPLFRVFTYTVDKKLTERISNIGDAIVKGPFEDISITKKLELSGINKPSETININEIKSNITSQRDDNDLVYGMNQALEQVKLAKKSRSWFLSFIQPPVGGYIINADGIEGRGLNDTKSLIHAETLTIINFLENAVPKSSLPENEKKAVVLLLSQIKMNATSLKSDMFRNNRIVKKLKINYSDKTVDDLFKETNELLKYIDDVLENPLASAELYCTLAPCNKCAKTIAKLNFKSVVFGSYPANKTHQGYEYLYSNGTEIISGILRKETDKYIRNYKIMNSTPLMTKIASSMQNIRRSAMSFFNFFKITRSKLYSQQQKDILINKLFNNLSHSDFVYGNVEYALLCGNDEIETFKYAYEMLKNGKIKKLIISGGCGRLTVSLLKAVRESGIKNTGSKSVEKFISMSNSEFSSLEKELSKASNSEIKTRLRSISPQISEAAIIKFIILNIIAKSDGISEKRKSNIESKIILETESSNTYENLQNSKKLLPSGVKNIAVIQTPVQQMRTMGTANRILDPNIALYSMTVNKTNKNYSELLQPVLGEYARLIVYTLKGDIAPKDSFQNTGLNAVSEDTYDSIFSLIETFDVKQASLVRTNLRNLFKSLGNDSYEKVLELLNEKALADKVSQIKLEKIKSFIDWIYEDPGVMPQTVFFNNGRHAVSKAFMTAFLESPYIFASSFSEKFREWFLRQHSPDNKEIRTKGLNRLTSIVRASTFIAVAVLAFSVFYAVPAGTLILTAVQWVVSLIVPHIIWNIKNPHARLEKTPRGERKNYDVYRKGKLVAQGKRSPSEASIINTTAYNLCEGRLWEKNQIEYELRAVESDYQETVAPAETSPSGEYKIPPQFSGDGILFKVVIPNINNKLPAQYQYTYAHSPKGAAANILFKIFKAIKEGKLTNGRYVDVPYLMDTAEETADYNNIGDDTDDVSVSDKNIVKILAIIFKDYNLGDIIEEHKSNSLALRTDKSVSRIVKKELKAYSVAISGLNKHKSLEVYQQVYASSEEEAVKNAVRELVLAKERGELILGWYGDIAVNRKNIDKIASAIYSKYADKIDHIVTEIPEVTKISEAADGRSAVKKETRQKEIETSRELYPEFTQNIQYKFTVSIPIAGTKNIFNDTVEAYSPKQALFKALLRYYKNREKALEQERAFWTEYDIKTLGAMLNCKMNMPPFTISDGEYVMPEQKDGQKEYIVKIPGLNDTKELARYRRVYAINPEDAVKKAVLALVSAKQKKELSSGWYAGIGISIDKAADISDAVFKQHPYDIEKFVTEVKREPVKKPENEIIKDEINELQQIINWNDLSFSDLPRLKAFLEKIGAWDNKLARAGMMYVIENKIAAAIDKDGKIIFADKDGNIFNYGISSDGRFEASREYFEKMGQLSRILNIADMDENIAPRAKVMDARMKNIFSKLHLYDIGKPVIVTGAMFQRLKSRIDDISPVIIDLVDQIFVVSARERITYDGESWILDDHYLDEFSKARMLPYDKKMIREAFYNDIEVPWHDLFIDFANDIQKLLVDNRNPSYNDFVKTVVSQKYDEDIESVIQILNLKDKQELFNLFNTKKRKEIKNIINIIYKETKAKENKDRFLKIMRLVSILELIRVYRSGVEEDFSEKDYIMSEAFKREPMVANEERTTYVVTQIRPMAVRDCLVDYCSDVILREGLEHFSIRAGGKSTIDFFKNNTNKAVAIKYLSKRFNIPSDRIIYSGDELSVGVDACVVDLKNSGEENYGDLVILNTGRDDVEGTVPLRSIYPNISGIAANTLMFERIFDFISYNIAMIATKPDFKPANIVADLKDSVQIPVAAALSESGQKADKIKNAAFIDFAAENIKRIMLFMQLFIINFIYKDTTSYTVIADASDVKKTELAVYLAENGVKVNLILKGDSGLQTENKRGLKNGFALIEKKGNLTKYGYEQTTAAPEEEIFKELIEDVSQEDMSKNKIIDVSDFQLAGIDEQSLKNIFAKNGAKTVVGTGASSNSLFMALLEEVKVNPVNSVSSTKPLVSVNITEADLTEYNNRQYMQMKKTEGIDSIVISVDNKMLNENSAAISGLLKLAHEEGLKVEFMYFIANQEELELLTGHIDERMRNYRTGGTGIDGLRLDLSKLVYNDAVKRELIRLKMTVNKQSLNALFAVELYDIAQELLED